MEQKVKETTNSPAGGAFSKELKEELIKLLQVDIDHFKSRTEEQHEAACRAMERRTTTQGRSIAETQFNAHFVVADANKDKLLNFEEYLVF